jgi:hypothetical protein
LVDRLYDDPPVLVTLVQAKQALHGGVLRAFRGGSYELLGQMTAGFFSVRQRAEDGRAVMALTVQVAASHAGRNVRRLGLNVLGSTPAGEPLEHLSDLGVELPWLKPVRWAQSALETLAVAPRDAALLERRVEGILQGLARRIGREHRARGRRTRHAEQRHASGTRPTRKAVDDARAVPAEALLVDGRRGTVVVVGDRGRTHFFTVDGQHVSSVRYSREAIERKLKLAHWLPATGAQARTFRKALLQSDASETSFAGRTD